MPYARHAIRGCDGADVEPAQILEAILAALLEDDARDALLVLMSASLYLPRLRSVYMPTLRAVREKHPDKVVMLAAWPGGCGGRTHRHGFPVVMGALYPDTGRALDPAAARLLPPLPAPLPPAPRVNVAALLSEAGAKQALAVAGASPAGTRCRQRRRGCAGEGDVFAGRG